MTQTHDTTTNLTLQLRVGCEFVYSAAVPVPTSVQVEARRYEPAQQVLREEWSVAPPVAQHCFTDVNGNLNRRMLLPSGRSTIRYDAIVAVANLPDEVDLGAVQHLPEELPDDALVFTLPSRYCLSDVLAEPAWQLFGQTPQGWARVQAICDWVHGNIVYQAGSSHTGTTSFDVYNAGAGICRDFAHLAISFARALNIPARYVFGYLPDLVENPPDTPMDFHAWFEAYLGGRWRTFDARHNVPRLGRVPVGRGRDAVDCAMVTSFGPAVLETMEVWADVAAR